jgi:hypothetical protein
MWRQRSLPVPSQKAIVSRWGGVAQKAGLQVSLERVATGVEVACLGLRCVMSSTKAIDKSVARGVR